MQLNTIVARRIDLRPEDYEDAEVSDGAGELGFFSPHSWWPILLSASVAVVGISVALQLYWLWFFGGLLVVEDREQRPVVGVGVARGERAPGADEDGHDPQPELVDRAGAEQPVGEGQAAPHDHAAVEGVGEGACGRNAVAAVEEM